MESKSVVDNAGIGNYKGIMLCNRPNPSGQVESEDRRQFACGVVPEPSGMSVSILKSKERVKAVKDKKDSVLSKHRRWLHQLQRLKEQQEEQAMQEAQKKEALLKRLAENATKHDVSQFFPSNTNSLSYGHDVPETNDSIDAKLISVAESKNNTNISSKHVDRNAESKQKPAWALSLKESDKASELCESSEVDSLLDFANSLDFDKYINDIEVKTMIEQIQKRISGLEQDIADEDNHMISSVSNTAGVLHRPNFTTMDATTEYGNKPEDKASMISAAAMAVLEKDADMQAIHSSKSIAAIIKAVEASSASQPKVVNEPRTVVHEPADGLRKDRFDASNLPYLHRNPAV